MIHVKETSDRTGNTGERPEAFIRNDQFNFIKDQTRILITGQATSNDAEVLNVLRHLAHEKVFKLFPSLNDEQKAVLNPLTSVKETADAEAFLEGLEPYIIPFKAVTDAALKKLFPKAKKLKGPKLESADFRKMSYLAWTESSNLMYLVYEKDGRLDGINGTLARSHKKGICSICNRHSDVGMFTAKTKGSGQDNYIKRGNYICQDADVCNGKLNSLERLEEFTDMIQK
ncbi:FusB/FusC family EF-G-binding protein [Planococcus shenhongbingii]|uniref:FusB/FusC family EF-G-binding protein n=1 Tax=Planococcus shenhongbingii TaxID=3058398 RepID=A0ABT8NBF1_9BACL|nr:FusB/FusC family EF-G-binding protein [Planococcus sp. N017]MDN7245217.1 FusB/FusC family EF-G-binding protein [Planococcus sp. N017]